MLGLLFPPSHISRYLSSPVQRDGAPHLHAGLLSRLTMISSRTFSVSSSRLELTCETNMPREILSSTVYLHALCFDPTPCHRYIYSHLTRFIAVHPPTSLISMRQQECTSGSGSTPRTSSETSSQATTEEHTPGSPPITSSPPGTRLGTGDVVKAVGLLRHSRAESEVSGNFGGERGGPDTGVGRTPES